MSTSALNNFSPATRTWFTGAFPAPTAAQEGAWASISAGQHTLIVAPTGSGKTLSAFLWALDRLHQPQTPAPTSGTQVLYISPLKALGVDVERNLRAPLIGIAATAQHLGLTPPSIRVGVRSGDTPAQERRQLISNPPDILITTPESLFLMLTSKARSTLTNVHTIIIDEIHAVAGTKRGAHLAVSLERLDQILPTPAQRIGLSATVEPVETVARFLGGNTPVTIVQPPSTKQWDLTLSVPVPDMTALGGPNTYGEGDNHHPFQAHPTSTTPFSEGAPTSATLTDPNPLTASPLPQGTTLADALGIHPITPPDPHQALWDAIGTYPGEETTTQAPTSPQANPQPKAVSIPGPGPRDYSGYQASIWPHIEERIVDLIYANRSTIVFTNSRGLSEKLTARLNEIHLDRLSATQDLTITSDPRTGAHTYTSTTAPPTLARAHHGSVSKDQRTLIEDALKTGQLRCVVATSSLELGIDMGAVDLVIQVEAPHSVASGLQRVGRAGHQVGETSRGYLYPKHRGDLLTATVTTQHMLQGKIEPLRIPTNPLDILAQQTVAATALGPISVENWYEALRNTAPFATLPRAAYEATLDLLAGRYPSDEFAELRPRITWDRDAGTIEGRPGAQRLAVTSGGTIPDRGLFPVYIAGAEDSKAPKRVGELDEEMVYESRAGDVIALGASSWRIENISHDRVTVTPAPGIPGKLPFWHGDSPGRPVDLGRAIGAFTRDTAAAITRDPDTVHTHLSGIGLDTWAADNLIAYLRDQTEATGQVPHHQHLLLERFRDEIGDWRLILHSPLGMPVHSPWALAVGARIEERYGINASAMAADDGIVLRIPATEAEPPGADLFLFDPQELDELVADRVGSSALFASRFRENAARALLLPRKDPGRRTPLWQQRQRGAQLLDVARKYPTFPILLETARECLQDVYDLPSLLELHRDISAKKVKVSEVEAETPSPFARTLLFGYVAQFLYEGDSPLAERRAAALALDPALLAELLGKDELRELLDADVIRSTEARLQHTAEGYRLRGMEGAADLLRLLGPLTAEQVAARLRDPDSVPEQAQVPGPETETDPEALPTPPPAQPHLPVEVAQEYLDELVARNRALFLRHREREFYASIEDAARLRDTLGVPLPMGVPLAFIEPVENPLADMVARYARTHAPFTAAQAAEALGLGVSVVDTALRALATERRVTSGEFLPEELRQELALERTGLPAPAVAAPEWVDSGVLRTLRARSLAALRADVEPVEPAAYARFVVPWQHVGGWELTVTEAAPGTFGVPAVPERLALDEGPMVTGYEGLLTVVDQLAGVRVPASALESLVLRSRIVDYNPALLDQAMSSGDVIWCGDGALAGDDGWVSLHLGESAALTLPDGLAQQVALDALGSLERAVYDCLSGGLFFPQIQSGVAEWALAQGLEVPGEKEVSSALWSLVWAGLVTNDTLGPVRALLAGGASAHRVVRPAPRARGVGVRRGAARLAGSRYGVGRPAQVRAQVAPVDAGRWSRVEAEELDPTIAAHARAELLMDRYGVLTRGAVAAEDVPGGFAGVYRVLSAAEEKGLARRGYFVEGLGAAQFSTATTVDRLRESGEKAPAEAEAEGYAPVRTRRYRLALLAATDPANPYGATLPWPEPVSWAADAKASRHRPGRKAGACVVLVDGELVLYLERGGRTLLPFSSDPARVELAAPLLAQLLTLGAAESLAVETVGGVGVLDSPAPLPAQPGEEAPGVHPVLALRQALLGAGFYPTPKGLRLRRT